MDTLYFLLGLAASVSLGLVLGLFLKKKVFKGTGRPQYDERQQIGRGKAFKAGFFTLLILGALRFLLEVAELLPGDLLLWDCGSLLTGIGVFAVTAIRHDAYMAMNCNSRRFMWMGGFFTVGLSFIGCMNLRSGDRTVGITNFMVAALWVILLVALLLHRRETEEA